MTKKELQLFLGQSIVESKMTRPSKLQMLNFIQHEASEEQLMVLIMDGKIVKLDEQSKEIARDRFNLVSEELNIGKATVAAAAILAASTIYKQHLSKAARACKDFVGPKRAICLKKYKELALKNQLQALSSKMSSCSKDKNPEKCKMKIQKKINSIKMAQQARE